MKQKTISILGWYGVVAVISAYGMLSLGFIESPNLQYQLLNLTGAAALGYETWSKRDLQPAVLNVIWAVIAIIAIVSLLLA